MAGLTDRESKLVAALDEQALVDHLVSLVRTPSITGTDEESELQHRAAMEYGQWGLDVDSWKLDLAALREDDRFPGTEADRVEGFGMVASTGSGRPALILQGHVDVVPTGDLTKWDVSGPFSGAIRGDGYGWLHGRGACDMKAGVAANAAVVRTLATAGVTLQRPLAVHTVISEEDGGVGALASMVRGHTGDACVIAEPTGGQLITANAGALTFQIVVDGLAAHGSTRRSGHSAFDAFLPVYAALHDLERSRNQIIDPLFAGNALPYAISIGTVRTGDWASSVPDRLVAEGRLGVILGEQISAARSTFEAAVDAAARRDPWLRDHRPIVTWPGGQFASGRLPDDEPLIDEMADAAQATHGRRPVAAAAPYGSDLRLMLGVGGIPTLHYGPGVPEDAHAPRERVSIQETLDVARSLLVLTLRRCGIA
ncbi:MAG: ArgE/DapE family deacylase [Allobranchiibius sp.]